LHFGEQDAERLDFLVAERGRGFHQTRNLPSAAFQPSGDLIGLVMSAVLARPTVHRRAGWLKQEGCCGLIRQGIGTNVHVPSLGMQGQGRFCFSALRPAQMDPPYLAKLVQRFASRQISFISLVTIEILLLVTTCIVPDLREYNSAVRAVGG